jgi:choline kinase
MPSSTTVVIACAGLGSRLGLGIPKALIQINGKSIIRTTLEHLSEFEDIRIVVGYQAEKVIAEAISVRKDIIFVFNHDYLTTNTAHSLYLGANKSKEFVLSIDGDLLVAPSTFFQIKHSNGEFLGLTMPYSEQPVLCGIEKESEGYFITSFSRTVGSFEWSGLMKIRSNKIKPEFRYVYEMLESSLPIKGMVIECAEIDTSADLEYARSWANKFFEVNNNAG